MLKYNAHVGTLLLINELGFNFNYLIFLYFYNVILLFSVLYTIKKQFITVCVKRIFGAIKLNGR